jgi:transposase
VQRDGRSFDHRTLETIRLMAIERVREGERPSAVIASYGFCRTTIYKWLRAVKARATSESPSSKSRLPRRDWQ